MGFLKGQVANNESTLQPFSQPRRAYCRWTVRSNMDASNAKQQDKRNMQTARPKQIRGEWGGFRRPVAAASQLTAHLSMGPMTDSDSPCTPCLAAESSRLGGGGASGCGRVGSIGRRMQSRSPAQSNDPSSYLAIHRRWCRRGGAATVAAACFELQMIHPLTTAMHGVAWRGMMPCRADQYSKVVDTRR